MYASLKSHEFDLINEVLNLIWLLSLYVAHNSSFNSNQFLVLNLDYLFCVLSNKFVIFIYSVITYYYYVNLRSSIIFCLCSGDVYLSVRISSSFVSGLFFFKTFKTLVILQQFYFQLNHQFLLLFFELLFLK